MSLSFGRVAFALLLALGGASAFAQSISITNPSFEIGNTGYIGGNLLSTTNPGTSRITGWTNQTAAYGSVDNVTSSFTAGLTGTNAIWVNGAISQGTGATFKTGVTYTLSIDVGNPSTVANMATNKNLQFGFRNAANTGFITAGQRSINGAEINSLADGTFRSFSIAYTAVAADAGTTIRIGLDDFNAESTSYRIDNVRLTTNEIPAAPSAPTGLTATAGNAHAVLTWNSLATATTYSVLRSTTSGSGYVSVATGLTSPSYTDTGLTNGTPYFYVVTATNLTGTSANSPEMSCLPSSSETLPAVYNPTLGVYELKPDTSTRLLSLKIPDGVTEVRGILIYGNGASGDATYMATHPELVAFAQNMGFVVLATGYWGNFPSNSSYEINLFEASLRQYAAVTRRPEIVRAPWMPMGFSNGGQMSYGLNALRPSKVIGFITNKGGFYNNTLPSAEALRTPGLLIAGATDTDSRRTAIKGLFTGNRPRGALWAWVEEENTAHDEGNTQQIILPFLAECYRLRYPRDQSPVNGPVTLKALNEWEGWLVDQTTWATGFPSIYRYDLAPADPRTLGWVPSQRIAFLYRAFAAYNRLSYTTGGSSTAAWANVPTATATAPATLTHSVTLPDGTWNRVEFYEGEKKIGEAFPAGGNSPQTTMATSFGGMRAFHTVVTRTSGTAVTTPIRRVFVKGPAAPSAYDTWSQALPAGRQGRNQTGFDDGVPNLVRFAFGLGSSQRGTQVVQSGGATEQIGGVTYTKFSYTISDQARDAQIQVTPFVSDDLTTFKTVGETQGVILRRSGNLIEILTPSTRPKTFVRLSVEDPLP